MNKIIKGIYIGGINDSNNYKILDDYDIVNIVNCTNCVENHYPNQFKYINIPLVNNQVPEMIYLHHLNDFINEALENNNNVLIHSIKGNIRAPTICILYLMYNNYTYNEAYNLVNDKVTNINIDINKILKNKIISSINELKSNKKFI